MKIEPQQQSTPQDVKLKRSLQQFEAMMTMQILKPLVSSSEATDEHDGGAKEQIRQLATEALASGIAAHGGFGIAKQVALRLQAQGDAARSYRSK